MLEEYFSRMRALLPDFDAYADCLQRQPYRAIRVNTLKIDAETFQACSPFSLKPVRWEENGFYIEEDKPGKSIYHDAGLFYVQEPSAMCAVPLLDVQPGERVLDLCSAPGGKGTQIAQAMRGAGVLVLNEKIPDRAKIVLQNVERLGIRNAIVTNMDPSALAEFFPSYFDKILVDAPCSGEGMFRKEPAAIENWSPEAVAMCAQRQRKILESANKMLAGGGKLVYSTCTFSPEEDEGTIADFLKKNPQYDFLEQKKIFPHREEGEGHFAALLQKKEGERKDLPRNKSYAGKSAMSLYRGFEKDFLKDRQLGGHFYLFGNSLCVMPEELFPLYGLKVLRAGWKLGDLLGSRFEPAHSFAMGLKKEDFALPLEYSQEDILRYLKGETLSCAREVKGWCGVLFGRFPVGLGKASDGVVKNHYPKGLRRR